VTRRYDYLHLGHVVFFHAEPENYWDRIPPEWRDELTSIPLGEKLLSVAKAEAETRYGHTACRLTSAGKRWGLNEIVFTK
jgi:hypothetical protein